LITLHFRYFFRTRERPSNGTWGRPLKVPPLIVLIRNMKLKKRNS